MSADRNDRVVVVLGTATAEIDATLRALGLAPLDEGNEHATVWLPAEKVARPAPPPEGEAPEPTPVPLLVTIAEAAIALGVGRSTVYDLIATGELEVVHIGRAATSTIFCSPRPRRPVAPTRPTGIAISVRTFG